MACAALLWFLSAAAAPTDPMRPAMLSAEAQAAWPMIGRVNVRGIASRRMCTGTLIAPDRVLTAAHCLVAPDGGRRPAPEDVIFVAGWRQGTGLADRAAVAFDAPPGIGLGGTDAGRFIGQDIAVIHLAEPIPPETVPALPTAALPPETRAVTILGYRFDRPHALSRQTGCRITARTASLIRTDCAVVPGTSGAPAIADTVDGPRVVGVVSASGPTDSFAARVPPSWD